MAFTEKDLISQVEQLAVLQAEFERMQAQEAALMKAANLTSADLTPVSEQKLSPEMQKVLEEATDAAKRAGAARATQSATVASMTGNANPAAARPGIVRM